MKTKFYLLAGTLLLLSASVFSQNPLQKQWDKTFGGTNNEALKKIIPTQDGGFLLTGFSNSGIGGDKTQPDVYEWDYWLVKTDASGNKQWDKTFGGLAAEYLTAAQQANDGSYIVGGFSYSETGGDKTQTNQGANDYWIIKTDALGNKLWDKDFGGTEKDFLYSISLTNDGGYILGGGSLSGITGDKSEENRDSTESTEDYWMVKIDANGNKEWDKTFGGTETDELHAVKQTPDGGYLLAGMSNSRLSGDKTEASWSGSYDYWVVKTDALGNKLWDHVFGGSQGDYLFDMNITADGGAVLGGYSGSPMSGNKSQNNYGGNDFWIVKLNASGIKEWDKVYGGTEGESYFGNVSQTPDGGFLVSGSSSSNNFGGLKTENNLSSIQTWVVKTDALGNFLWDKTLFTVSDGDGPGLSIALPEGCYVFANYTNANAGGYKTENNRDTISNITTDYWMVKFCDTTATPTAVHTPPEAQTLWQLYPNPAASSLTVTFNDHTAKQLSFCITNLAGQIVYSENKTNFNELNTTLDINNLSAGMYMLTVTVNDQKSVTKLVKQ